MQNGKGIVRGTVMEARGNLMPSIGPERSGGGYFPLQVRVVFFSPPLFVQECEKERFGNGMVYRGSRQPDAEVLTNQRGDFEIELDPGDYTMMVESSGGLLGFVMGVPQGYDKLVVEPVRVNIDQCTTRNFTVNRATH